MSVIGDEGGFFTIVGPPDEKVSFKEVPDIGAVKLQFPEHALIEKQQLGELGVLFLALAGDIDGDSVAELLDGYNFSQSEQNKLAYLLEGIAATIRYEE